MKSCKYLVALILVFTTQVLLAQKKEEIIRFRPPLDIPLYLSGSFGELRSGHFHSGIDIKTEGTEGKKVYAVADGYVSRIKISPGGYGKALYITHPGGYVSVYGHLSRFSKKLEKAVEKAQYERERYFIELFPDKEKFPVKKGEVIACSGNSGSSAGPHLHFEIRDAKSQQPLNPLSFPGIKTADHLHPRIVLLAVYPVDDTSLINGTNDTLILPVYGTGKNCRLPGGTKLELHGRISFGLYTYDAMDKISNKNGIYGMEASMDSIPFFKIEMNRLSFGLTRYINSLIDYRYFQKKGKRIIRTEIDSNNRLFNYVIKKNNGIICLNDEKPHRITFNVNDIYGNKAMLSFTVTGNVKPVAGKEKKKKPDGTFFAWDQPHFVKGKHFKADFPAGAFYRSFYFNYEELPGIQGGFSPLIRLHNRFVPVHKRFEFSISPDTVWPEIKDKLYIARLGEGEDTNYYYAGSERKGGYITSRIRNFGTYTILADTSKPEIVLLNIKSGQTVTKGSTLKFKIIDRESGIKSYKALLNGKWFLMEYDPKNDLITGKADEHFSQGKNILIIKASDRLGNIGEFQTVLLMK